MCSQHDETSTHYTWDVREYLYECFPNHWLGCCRPHAWSLKLPDLAPLDYYLWNYLKNVVYETNVDSRSSLRRYLFAETEHICNHFHNTVSATHSVLTCAEKHKATRRGNLSQLLWNSIMCLVLHMSKFGLTWLFYYWQGVC